ncbi:MAG: diaminopimelate epimerase [Thermodesulfobacteriota bacterium]
MRYLRDMEIRFHKMHGTLNDFVVFHDLEGQVELSAEQIAHLCHRHAGVGADGLIVVRPSAHADFFMDYRNSDGSLAEMCGNGIRCLAKYAYDNRLTRKTELLVETRGGIKQLELFPGRDGAIERVRVNMGAPIFAPSEIPVAATDVTPPILDMPLRVDGREFKCSMVSMGNPHCVIVTNEDLAQMPSRYGPQIESHGMFPAKTNVEFIQVPDRTRIRMRVWERGCGETRSCGTGACASAVVARVKGLVEADVVVELLGGELLISWNGAEDPVLMTGSATTAFFGTISF